MRMVPPGEPPRPQPNPTPLPPAAAKPGSAQAAMPRSQPGKPPAPMGNDRIDGQRDSRGASMADAAAALGEWAKDEWPTVAGVAHGLASAPGVVSKAWLEAAEVNTNLGRTIRNTVDHWEATPASGRETSIDGLRKTAGSVSKTASIVADELGQANRLPLALETAVNAATDDLPPQRQDALNRIVRHATTALNQLPAPVKAHADAAARHFDAAAQAQTAKAAGRLPSLSRVAGSAVVDSHGSLAASKAVSTLIDKAPWLRETPAAGVALTGAAIAYDVHGGKSVADATVANISASVVGAVAGGVAEDALSSLAGGVITDGAAEALGVAAATGPVGWTVAAGVIAGAAAGYGVYKAVESQPGQDLIDGISRLDRGQIDRGLSEARVDAIAAGVKLASAVSSLSSTL